MNAIFVNEFKRVHDNKKENLEDALLHLPLMATPVDTLKVIRETLGLSFKEADDLIFNSVMWCDIKVSSLKLRDIADDILLDTEIDLTKPEEKDSNKTWWGKMFAFFVSIIRNPRSR